MILNRTIDEVLDNYSVPQLELLRDRHDVRKAIDDLRGYYAVYHAASTCFGGKGADAAAEYRRNLESVAKGNFEGEEMVPDPEGAIKALQMFGVPMA